MQPPAWVADYIGREFDQTSWHCWELCRCIAADHLDFEWPSFDWHGGSERAAIIRDQSKNWHQACTREQFLDGWRGEVLGDVAVIRLGSFGGHVGMVVAPNRLLHVEESAATSIIEMRSASWKRRIEGVYQWIG